MTNLNKNKKGLRAWLIITTMFVMLGASVFLTACAIDTFNPLTWSNMTTVCGYNHIDCRVYNRPTCTPIIPPVECSNSIDCRVYNCPTCNNSNQNSPCGYHTIMCLVYNCQTCTPQKHNINCRVYNCPIC